MKSSQSRLQNKTHEKCLILEDERTHHSIISKQPRYVYMNAEELNIMGRLASIIANVINGKYCVNVSLHNKPNYIVILYNCHALTMTGNKMEDKEYVKYTGYAGGQRAVPMSYLWEKNPEFVLKKLITKRMINKSPTRDERLARIQCFMGMPTNFAHFDENMHEQRALKYVLRNRYE